MSQSISSSLKLLAQEKSAHEREVRRLAQELDSMHKTVEAQRSQSESCRDTIRRLSELMESKDNELRSYRSTIKLLTVEKEEFSSEMDKLKGQNNKLEGAMTKTMRTTTSSRLASKYRDDVIDLGQQLDRNSKSLQSSNDRLSDAKKEISILNRALKLNSNMTDHGKVDLDADSIENFSSARDVRPSSARRGASKQNANGTDTSSPRLSPSLQARAQARKQQHDSPIPKDSLMPGSKSRISSSSSSSKSPSSSSLVHDMAERDEEISCLKSELKGKSDRVEQLSELVLRMQSEIDKLRSECVELKQTNNKMTDDERADLDVYNRLIEDNERLKDDEHNLLVRVESLIKQRDEYKEELDMSREVSRRNDDEADNLRQTYLLVEQKAAEGRETLKQQQILMNQLRSVTEKRLSDERDELNLERMKMRQERQRLSELEDNFMRFAAIPKDQANGDVANRKHINNSSGRKSGPVIVTDLDDSLLNGTAFGPSPEQPTSSVSEIAALVKQELARSAQIRRLTQGNQNSSSALLSPATPPDRPNNRPSISDSSKIRRSR